MVLWNERENAPFVWRVFRTTNIEGNTDSFLIPKVLESTIFQAEESNRPDLDKNDA